MNTKFKELNDLDLIEELHRARDILDLCVHGALNTDYKTTAEGLFWIKEDMNLITRELEERLLNKSK